MKAAYRSRNGMVILLSGCLEASRRRLTNVVAERVVLVAAVEVFQVIANSNSPYDRAGGETEICARPPSVSVDDGTRLSANHVAQMSPYWSLPPFAEQKK